VYRRELLKFERWAAEQGCLRYPILYEGVSLYLVHVATTSQSAPMAERASAAVRSEHRRRNLPSPTDDPGIVDLMKGISRMYGRPPRPVAPLTRLQLKLMLEQLDSGPNTFLAARTAWVALLCFQMSSRCGDLKRLRVHDFDFQRNGDLIVRFKQLKNVSVRHGFRVKIQPHQGNWCPVQFTKDYFRFLSLTAGDFVTPVIYRRVNKSSGQVSFSVAPSRQASNASLRLHFRDALRAAGFFADDHGLHSPRRGSVQALQEGGFSASDINNRVGWKSASMLPLYTSDSGFILNRQSRCLHVSDA